MGRMSVINGAGNIIVERELTKDDEYLAGLSWPENYYQIRELGKTRFKRWMYGLNPQTAMLLSCDRFFQIRRDLKLKKWSTLWRLAWE